MSAEQIVIKGQAWIQDDKVYQENTIMTSTDSWNKTEVIVEDIWEDLLSAAGTYKKADGRAYYYWEYKQAVVGGYLNFNGQPEEVTVRLECPKPKPGLFDQYFKDGSKFKSPKDWGDDETIDNTLTSDWARYWAKQLRDADLAYFKTGTIQKKSVTFVTKETISYDLDGNAGEVISETTVEEVNNTEFGDNPKEPQPDNLITDLLYLFDN